MPTDYTFSTDSLTKVLSVDRERILETMLSVADESSTWLTECCLTPEDKECAVICLAQVAGAVNLTKKLLKTDELPFNSLREDFTNDIG